MEKRNNRAMTVIFKNSLEKKNVDLTTLIDSTKEFLQIYQQSDFAQTDFWEIVADENGQAQFSELLKSTGFTDDAEGFFSAVLNEVALGTGEAVVIQGVILPHALLVALLEQILPGHGYISIKSVQQLVDLTNCDIPEEQKDDIQKVIEIYPVRLSRHTIRQLMVSKAVAYQYMPFIQELNPTGFDNTWIGQFHDGLFEQMYQNRVIFLLNMACPVYCRFCFRKHKDSRNEKNPTPHDVKKAVGQVEKSKSIKEIVVTGGDPFMHRPNMEATIEGLMQVDHVQTLRLATRSIAYYPNMFLENDEEYLNYLKGKNLQLQKQGKRMEVATHFIHPDEISPKAWKLFQNLSITGSLFISRRRFSTIATIPDPNSLNSSAVCAVPVPKFIISIFPAAQSRGIAFTGSLFPMVSIWEHFCAQTCLTVLSHASVQRRRSAKWIGSVAVGPSKKTLKMKTSSGSGPLTHRNSSRSLPRLPTTWRSSGATMKGRSTSSTWQK